MELNISTSLLVLIVIVFLIGISFKRFFKRFQPPIQPGLLSPSSLHSIKELLLFLVTNRETQRRLFITVGVLIVFRLLAYIPLPGTNQKAFTAFFHGLAGTLDIDGLFARFSIISLGIMPFLSSCLLIQLLSVVISPLRRATFGGEEERYKIVRYTYLLTMGLALVQSYWMSVWLDTISGVNIVTMPSVAFRIVATVTLTAACFLLLFLADIINKYGIGNGIAILFISGLFMGLLRQGYQYRHLILEDKTGFFIAVLILVVIIGSLYLAFFFTSRERKIDVKAKRAKKEFTIPLRVSWVADAPLLLSSTIVMLPASLITFSNFPLLLPIASYLRPGTILYVIVEGILLFFCTYIYASIIFQPHYIQNLLQKYSFAVKEIEGKEPTSYLDSSLSRILIITIILLFVMPKVSALISSLLPAAKRGIGIIFVGGSTCILIFAGVFFDILSQLEFFYQKNKRPNKNFSVAYVAFDEIEARIKSEYLRGEKIDALVEPLRFTWGIPIRTAIDQYRIYVPEKEVAKARKLIE